jgi:hypothetical protein
MTALLIALFPVAFLSLLIFPALRAPIRRLRGDFRYYPVWSDCERSISLARLRDIDSYPLSLILLVLLSEDPDFFRHRGFQPAEIRRRLRLRALRGGPLHGGSSISQQLVKNIFLDFRRSFLRKLRELVLTVRLERECEKEEILFLYLDTIRLSEEHAGVSQAAHYYFQRPVQELSLEQAVVLCGIISRPRTFDRFCRNALQEDDPQGDPFPYERMFQVCCDLLRFSFAVWGAPFFQSALARSFAEGRDDISLLHCRKAGFSYESEEVIRKNAAVVLDRARQEVSRQKDALGAERTQATG